LRGSEALIFVFGLMLSDNWHKNIVIGTIAVVIAARTCSFGSPARGSTDEC